MNFKAEHNRLAEILLVEDNPADVALFAEVLNDCTQDVHLNIAADGNQAIGFLQRTGDCASAPRPDLVLLDLNLPGRDGHDVLATAKNDVSLRQIPIIILTSSPSDSDIFRCYDNHANAYMNKAHDFDGLIQLINSIISYWLMAVRLPTR